MGAKLLMGRFHPLKCCDGAFWRGKPGEEQPEVDGRSRGRFALFLFSPKARRGETVLVFVASLLD